MSKAFDLKKQLKLLDKSPLRRLFAEFGVLADVPWETLKSHDVGPVIQGWGAIDDDTRRKLEVVLQDVNELADERSPRVFVEDLEWRYPTKRDEFAKWSGLHDKALWAYLGMYPFGNWKCRRNR
ncbi:MAG: hypothetical protein LC104_03680 [Bacteroidales bacterium]|nr:hypothetical protein [Bacteroidales bacterium]